MQPGVMGCPKSIVMLNLLAFGGFIYEFCPKMGKVCRPAISIKFFSQENNMNLYIIIGFVVFVVIVAVCAHFWS